MSRSKYEPLKKLIRLCVDMHLDGQPGIQEFLLLDNKHLPKIDRVAYATLETFRRESSVVTTKFGYNVYIQFGSPSERATNNSLFYPIAGLLQTDWSISEYSFILPKVEEKGWRYVKHNDRVYPPYADAYIEKAKVPYLFELTYTGLNKVEIPRAYERKSVYIQNKREALIMMIYALTFEGKRGISAFDYESATPQQS